MGLEGLCPIHFTEEEIRNHLKDGEGWNEALDFWDSIAGLVNKEGWTSNDKYEEVRNMFVELRRNGLNTMTGKEWETFEAQTRWAASSSGEQGKSVLVQ